MLSLIRLQCYRMIGMPPVLTRYVSTKKKSQQHVTTSAPALRHNWFDLSSDIGLLDASNLSSTPDPSFNIRVIQYLSDSIKNPLTPHVRQSLLNSFQSWSPRELYELVNILGSHGMQPLDVLCLLINVPSGDKSILTIENLKRCFTNLFQLQFDTTTRSILVSNDPNIIQYDLSYIRERFDVLLCYFTKREIAKLVRTHKKLFSEKWSDLDYKINYLKIMLFASTRDIVESGALAQSIDNIRQRYLFVYRAGLFKRVRREEHYVKQRELNISLMDIFSTSVSTFLKRTTNNLLREDDYHAFVDSLKYETFDNEFERYLTFDHERKKWSRSQIIAERIERKTWMSEFDMYNNSFDDEDGDETRSLTVMNDSSLTIADTNKQQPSMEHPLSDYCRDRHGRKKNALNADPNLRI